jgi:hypothetical protein
MAATLRPCGWSIDLPPQRTTKEGGMPSRDLTGGLDRVFVAAVPPGSVPPLTGTGR